MRRILIDADGCPVVDGTIKIAKQFELECLILCDTSHRIEREGAQTMVFSKGADSVDFALVNLVHSGDMVVTQDYGLAAMCLARSALALKAFLRNDGERYGVFMEKVSSGETKLHTGTLTPYEIVAPFFRENVPEEERVSIDVTWNAQEDFTNSENALVVVDGSGSMYGGGDPLPAAVALSLGVYFAQRNTGAFRNHFITFSEKPQLVEIKGKDILDKIRYCHDFNEVANTSIQRVFELILNAAVKNRVPQSELPSTLYFISDMEFDCCTTDAGFTNFEYAKQLFARHGYALPGIVFWNVASRNRQQPVMQNEQGVALVSGCTPRVFSMLASGTLSPYAYMMEVLGSERYVKIVS